MRARERQAERESAQASQVDGVVLFVIYWLNVVCLSQFKQQGSSALPARICNFRDNSGAPAGSPPGAVLDLSPCCCFSITEPSRLKVWKKIRFPCHVRSDMCV